MAITTLHKKPQLNLRLCLIKPVLLPSYEPYHLPVCSSGY
jgi:hypothetical protein